MYMKYCDLQFALAMYKIIVLRFSMKNKRKYEVLNKNMKPSEDELV